MSIHAQQSNNNYIYIYVYTCVHIYIIKSIADYAETVYIVVFSKHLQFFVCIQFNCDHRPCTGLKKRLSFVSFNFHLLLKYRSLSVAVLFCFVLFCGRFPALLHTAKKPFSFCSVLFRSTSVCC